MASGSLSVYRVTTKNTSGWNEVHSSQHADLPWFQWVLYQTLHSAVSNLLPIFCLYLSLLPSMLRKCVQMLHNFMWISPHHILETMQGIVYQICKKSAFICWKYNSQTYLKLHKREDYASRLHENILLEQHSPCVSAVFLDWQSCDTVLEPGLVDTSDSQRGQVQQQR